MLDMGLVACARAMLICERSMLDCDPPEMDDDEASEWWWCSSGGVSSPPVELDSGGVSAPEADPPLEVVHVLERERVVGGGRVKTGAWLKSRRKTGYQQPFIKNS